MKERELPEGWESVKIREVATIEKNVATPDDLKGNSQNFIGLENIEKDSGRLINFSEISGDELRSTKFKFTPEHILYGKLRPYLNKVFLPDFEGVCSTDILTIKPHPKKVVKKFLELVLKGSDFVEYATTRFIGANLPRVSPSTVLDYSFALPPLAIQRQIVAVLEQAEAVKRHRQEADALTGALLQSVFLEMFGDPVRNEREWDVISIGDIANHVSSGSTPRGGSDVYDTSGILFIRSQNIHMNRMVCDDIAFISDEIHQSMQRSWVKSGDVLFNITGASIGRVAWFSGDDDSANVNQHVCIIRTNKRKIVPEFLSYQLSLPTYQSKILANQSGATRQAFNYSQIKNFDINMPPLTLQQQFARVVQDVERIRERQVASGEEIDGLCEGLMQRAFAGELAT